MHVCVVVQSCDEGWLEFMGSCYLHFAERDTWSEAERRCQELNAHLVSIRSQEEQQFVNCEQLCICVALLCRVAVNIVILVVCLDVLSVVGGTESVRDDFLTSQ